MATPIRIRRSPVPAKVPTNSDLLFAELGLNTFDGRVFLKQDQGKLGISTRVIEVGAGSVLGKTIFVTATGNDENSGLNEIDSKATIKGAAAISLPGDTIKVYPGIYVEDNPIILDRSVSLEGTELRNCIITPKNVDRDLFYVNNSVHVTDMSFRLDDGRDMTDGAAVLSFEPLVGVTSDRFFDAARMIRYNLDYIANETVGYITSTDYKNPAISIDSTNCADDIKDVYRAICHDITRGGNSKCIDAGKKYFDINGNLDHIVGFGSTTIDAFDYSRQIARAVINNATWGGTGAGSTTNVTGAQYGKTTGILTVTSASHGLLKDDPVKLVGLAFTCPGGSGITTTIFPDGKYGSIFPVKDVVGVNTFEVVVGISTIDHSYDTGGTVEKHQNHQSEFLQLRDLSIQPDPFTGFNNAIPSCSNVISAVYTCVGIVTSIIQNGINGNSSTTGLTTNYPGNSGVGFTGTIGVTSALYNERTGNLYLEAPGISVVKGDRFEIRDLIFSCDSGAGIGTTTQFFPSGKYGNEFYVDRVNADKSFVVNVGTSTLPHTYVSGGFIVDRSVAITTASYDNVSGIITFTSPGSNLKVNDFITIRDLDFRCPKANVGTPSTATYDPATGDLVVTINSHGLTNGDAVTIDTGSICFSCTKDSNFSTNCYPRVTDPAAGQYLTVSGVGINTFNVNVGVSSAGAQYSHTFVSAASNSVKTIGGGGYIGVTTTLFPDGTNGYDFKVLTGVGNTFSVNVGTSTIPHTYNSGGIVRPPYSPGVGPITQGPYVRNCTNFIPKSIGMRINGFDAEPADQEDIGVTGSMSVDSFTQFNQGGIGVSITNGAYAQLVSIFTICDEIAIYTNSGGQCDLTNSNASFGTFGLYSEGVGDETSKSIYRYTGIANTESLIENDVLVVSGLGQQRPYDGQALYFGEIFYFVKGLKVTNPGSGYTKPPRLTIDNPSGPQGATAEGSSNINTSGQVTSIDIIADGSQYRLTDNTQVVIDGPTGAGTTATAEVELFPIYYSIESATKPSAGISTIILNQRLNNTIGAGTTIFFSRVSLQITSSHSFEWVGSGNTINPSKPALGGVVIPENEVIEVGGGQVVYTSTDQAGNFRIGDGLVANQLTGTISGRSFDQSIINKVNPLIIALG